MATYASHDTATNEDDADSLTITKPSGLAAGDLMVAVLASSGASVSWDVITGWASQLNQGNGRNLRVLWKIADSTDAAASNFTFTHSNQSTMSRAGILYRITGTFNGAGNLASDGPDSQTGDATPTFGTGVTPGGTTALLIMGVITSTAGVTSSTYAVTNNNPTWTERGDLSVNGAADVTLSSATGSYAAGTTTGDYSLTMSSAVDCEGYIVAISDSASVNVTPTVITASTSLPAPVVSAGATVTVASAISATSSVPSPTVTTGVPDWSNVDKSSAPSWVNTAKS